MGDDETRAAPHQPLQGCLVERGWRRGYEEVAGPLGDLTPFFAWGGVVMERDLRPRPGRPGIDEAYFARVRRWTAYWKHRMGLTDV